MAAVPAPIRSPGPCVNPRNPHSASPALRALLVALEEWVSDGVAPPDSRVPRIADGTLVEADSVEDAGGARFRDAAGRQPHRRAGRLGRSAGPARQFLRCARLGGRCRRQRDRRHPPAADRGAARHLYRLERLPRPALRIVRPRRIADPVRPHPSANARRPATRAPRSKSATAAARLMSRRSGRRPRRWSRNDCCCRPTPRPMSEKPRAAIGFDRMRRGGSPRAGFN